MKSIASMLEQELDGAVEIKDTDFLHRYITPTSADGGEFHSEG